MDGLTQEPNSQCPMMNVCCVWVHASLLTYMQHSPSSMSQSLNHRSNCHKIHILRLPEVDYSGWPFVMRWSKWLHVPTLPWVGLAHVGPASASAAWEKVVHAIMAMLVMEIQDQGNFTSHSHLYIFMIANTRNFHAISQPKTITTNSQLHLKGNLIYYCEFSESSLHWNYSNFEQTILVFWDYRRYRNGVYHLVQCSNKSALLWMES